MTDRRLLPLIVLASASLLLGGGAAVQAQPATTAPDPVRTGHDDHHADDAHGDDHCDPHEAESDAARVLPGPDRVVRGPEPSPATADAFERDLQRQLAAERTAPNARGEAGARKKTTVRVFVHVIKPSDSAKAVSRKKIRRQMKVINRAYAGKQWKKARGTRFRFRVKKVDYTVNRAWYRAALNSPESKRMRKALHRGKKRDLNLYIAAPVAQGGMQVLGYATFPQRPKRLLKTDAVVIHKDSMPGGRFRGYNRGDTAVHEIGHWMGLYHTFHGACGKKGDRVADTPPEAIASFTCPKGRDTCPAPGKDPVRNFMNYSYDRCMHHFTPGQIDRMRKVWRVYRR